jgi:protein-L-isoaspartate O-methyltransferase
VIWETAAAALADRTTHRTSRWRNPLARTPRHLFVPKWWEIDDGQWTLREPASDEEWLSAAYRDRSLITRIGPWHADRAKADDHPIGRPTSSATLPSLLVTLYRHARIDDGDTLLDVGT